MDSEIIAAAILTAGFTAAVRQPLSTGRMDDSIREKFVEYLAFVREQTAAGKKKSSASKR